jgi:hypothetical protein
MEQVPYIKINVVLVHCCYSVYSHHRASPQNLAVLWFYVYCPSITSFSLALPDYYVSPAVRSRLDSVISGASLTSTTRSITAWARVTCG